MDDLTDTLLTIGIAVGVPSIVWINIRYLQAQHRLTKARMGFWRRTLNTDVKFIAIWMALVALPMNAVMHLGRLLGWDSEEVLGDDFYTVLVFAFAALSIVCALISVELCARWSKRVLKSEGSREVMGS